MLLYSSDVDICMTVQVVGRVRIVQRENAGGRKAVDWVMMVSDVVRSSAIDVFMIGMI